MLLRRQRSIFHLGEEGGGAQHVKMSVDDRSHQHHLGVAGSQNHGRQRREQQDAVVGLRILVAQHSQHARSHIVLKQMVLPGSAAAARHHRACGGFLRACTLCRRELSPDKDVYMYRGDQGFCSEECRWQQIMKDDAREREAAVMKQRRGLSFRHHHGSRSAAAPAVRGGVPRRLLAAA